MRKIGEIKMNKESIKIFILKYQLILYFIFVLMISWSFWIPMALSKLGLIYFPIPIIIGSTIGAFSPFITIIIFEKLTDKEISLQKIFANSKPKKNHIGWFFLAACLIPLSQIFGNFIYFILTPGAELIIINLEILESLGFWLLIIIPITFFAGLLTSPLGEEPGWRGFAIPRLQKKFGLLFGSLLLGTFWWTWHQPINIANGLEVSFYSYCGMVISSFIYDVLFNFTQKNVLCAMFAHSSSFITNTYIIRNSNNWWSVLILFFSMAILRLIEWKRLSFKNQTKNISQK